MRLHELTIIKNRPINSHELYPFAKPIQRKPTWEQEVGLADIQSEMWRVSHKFVTYLYIGRCTDGQWMVGL